MTPLGLSQTLRWWRNPDLILGCDDGTQDDCWKAFHYQKWLNKSLIRSWWRTPHWASYPIYLNIQYYHVQNKSFYNFKSAPSLSIIGLFLMLFVKFSSYNYIQQQSWQFKSNMKISWKTHFQPVIIKQHALSFPLCSQLLLSLSSQEGKALLLRNLLVGCESVSVSVFLPRLNLHSCLTVVSTLSLSHKHTRDHLQEYHTNSYLL